MNTPLINALMQGTFFAHPVTKMELIETHISWIILTGSYAYKIKKPVDFGFLNFTSLAQRKQYCEAELNLNKRSAPDIYEGLVVISGTPEAPCLDDTSSAIEYAVRMKQFESGQLFSELADADALQFADIDALAQQVSSFHKTLNPASIETNYGEPAQVFAPMEQNFTQIGALLSDPDQRRQIEQLEEWTHSTFERLTPLITQRREDGMVRECHGDMHLGNITLYQEKVTLFDCIEFNDDFRWIDTISDIAFLVMDFETHGLSHYANRFLNNYLEESGDYSGLKLLNFYKSYRAIVRAKICLLVMQDPSLDSDARAEQMKKYHQYIRLAETYTELPNRFVLTMYGISGTGKSTVALRLVDQLGAIRVRSDAERKRLYGLNIHEHPESELSKAMYNDDANQRTYQKLAELCLEVLDSGISVIVDATNLKQWQRDTIQNVADSRGVPLCIANCQASMAVIREWIAKRTREDYDPSDANLEIANRQLLSRDELSLDERSHTFVIHSDIVSETLEMASTIRRLYLKNMRD